MHKFIKIGAAVIFAVALMYFAVRIVSYHCHLVNFPYPNTYREGALMTTTEALVRGKNPYALALQPQYTNVYGIVYPLFVWPWAKLFGISMVVHRIVVA